MATDVKLACAALKASGLNGCATLSLLFPFGRERRIQALVRRRHSVLEAKNAILDALSRVQKPLEVLLLCTEEDIKQIADDPVKRQLLFSCSMSRAVLEDEARKWGTELGGAFEQALLELTKSGRILKMLGPAGEDVYFIVHSSAHQRFDLTLLNRVLQRGKEYGKFLRSREVHDERTEAGRTYRI